METNFDLQNFPSEITNFLKETNFNLANSLLEPLSVIITRTKPVDEKLNNYKENELPKKRPMLVIYKTGIRKNRKFFGFDITTQPPGHSYRGSFKSQIKDYQGKETLGIKSWINFDHIVTNFDNIRDTRNIWKLSDRDSLRFLAKLKRRYDDLIKHGFSSIQEQEFLDQLIEYLKNKFND